MMLLRKIAARYEQGGLKQVFLSGSIAIYKRLVRPAMPYSGYVMYNGVDIGRKRRYGDNFLSKLRLDYTVGDISTYESGLVTALSNNVIPGDKIVVVGGGVGVTVIHAALRTGEYGRVDCFEGDINGVNSVRLTAHRNNVSCRVHVHHAIVGENIGVYGDSGGAACVSPLHIPACDVLELDCEGSEIGILSQLAIRPRCIAVESHGFLGAPTQEVHNLLTQRGYLIEDLGAAEPHLSELCAANDIKVLVGRLAG